MTRIALTLALIGSVACNPAEAKDGETVWPELYTLENGGAVGGVEFTAGVDAEARQLENSLDIHLAAITNDENANTALTMDLMDGRGGARMSEGTADIDIMPDFKACTGPGFEERGDGGCNYSGQVLLIAERSLPVFVNVKLRTQAPDEWAGDPDLLHVFVDANAMEAQR